MSDAKGDDGNCSWELPAARGVQPLVQAGSQEKVVSVFKPVSFNSSTEG